MILLTRATGFVGGNLVKEMLNQELQVRCLVRNPSRAEVIKQPEVELVKGDITDKNSILIASDEWSVASLRKISWLRKSKAIEKY